MRYTFLSTFTCIAICACGALQPVDGSDSDGRAAPAVTAQGLTTTQSIPPGSGWPGINTNFVVTSSGAVRWNGGAWIVPLPVARGTMLTGVTLDVVPGVEADGSVLPIDVTITAQDSTGFSILGAAATPTSAAPAQPMTIAMSKIAGSSTSFTAVLTPRGFATAQLGSVIVTNDGVIHQHTLIVPVTPAGSSGRILSLTGLITGLDSDPTTKPQNVYAPLALDVGVSITAMRMRVQDGGSATRVQFLLQSATDDAETLTTVAASQISSGGGREETLVWTDTPVVTRPATNYVVKAFNTSGIFASFVYRLEVDYE